MSISNDDALEIIKSLQRASFGSCSSRIITIEEAEAIIWNQTEEAGRTPWRIATNG